MTSNVGLRGPRIPARRLMDHNEALRLHAVEKYVLGELPPSLRDEFEEHFFECQECALDVNAAAEFVDNVRAVLRFAA